MARCNSARKINFIMKENSPIVFISYSQDSPKHKQWVAKIGSDLLDNGVDVILDQWDLSFGEDLPKFMEKAVSKADRVLLICTETYVRKANDGKGGVGYESMIVTGELVKDLGSSKFIPVIRQDNTNKILPLFLSTRYYIDFSNNKDYKTRLDELLHELHNVKKIEKPKLGKNPFVSNTTEKKTNDLPKTVDIISILSKKQKGYENLTDLYNKAIVITQNDDAIAWRKLIQSVNKDFSIKLNKWFDKYKNDKIFDKNTTIERILEAASIYSPLICISLTGVESGKDEFKNQSSVLDTILYPKDWSHSGPTVYVNINRGIAFIYQALHGALSLDTNQPDLALGLATTVIVDKYNSKSLPLWKIKDLIGWPDSFGHNCIIAWNALKSLPNNWEWLLDIFGDTDKFITSICSYYALLNFYEYLDVFNNSNENIFKDPYNNHLDVPVCFLMEGNNTIQGIKLLIRNKDSLEKLIKDYNLDINQIKENWNVWIQMYTNWIHNAYKCFIRGDDTYSRFVDILG
jgi:hypothetical protein